MNDIIINKVSESGLMELNLEDYYPKDPVTVFDLKDYLYMGLILKEKDFREALKNVDWNIYQDKLVGVTCSADAIVPVWAYMLVVSYLQPFAKEVVFGDEAFTHKSIFLKNINSIDVQAYADQRVVVKGCGELPVGEFAYLEAAKLLRPVAKSIMYGEPCSTVPIFKKAKVL